MSKKKTVKKRKTKEAFVIKSNEAAPIEPSGLQVKQASLDTYISTIKKHPLLSRERELSIAKRYYKDKRKEDAQLLVLSNLRLVVKIAYEYVRTGIHILDLIQEGNIGLLQAVKEFDPYKGVKLSSYASYWIRAYIRSFILKNWSLVKIGTTKAQRKLFYQLQKEKNRLEAMGVQPEVKYLAEKLQVKEKEVVEMDQRLSGRDLSLYNPAHRDDEDGETLIQSVRDKTEQIDDELARRQVQEEFLARLNSFERLLSGKELIIFRDRLRSENPKTLQEIGESYGITRERVRQIESRVLSKLKEYIKQNATFMASTTINVEKTKK